MDNGEVDGTAAAGRVSRRNLLIGAGSAVGVAAVGIAIGVGAARKPVAPDPDPSPLQPPVARMFAADPFRIAHRGGSLDWPEMSALAYDSAVEAGVQGLEMSVVRTSDGVWFGAHDGSLDRITGTSGFVVRDHTWAEAQKLRILPPPDHPDDDPEPFVRVEEFIDAYARTDALWIDPKAVNRRYYPELMYLLLEQVSSPPDVYVAKCDGAITEWGELARDNGIQSWGFYYGRDLDADPALFDSTESAWSMLGLNWNASEEHWAAFARDGRPLVAHVIAETAQAEQALARGARGLMISGVTDVRL